MKPEELKDRLEQIKGLWASSAQGLTKIRNVLEMMSKNKVGGCERITKQLCIYQCDIANMLLEFQIGNKQKT
jgi:hypothetical protein